MTPTQSPTVSRPVVRRRRVTTVHTCAWSRDCLRCSIDEDVQAVRRDDQ